MTERQRELIKKVFDNIQQVEGGTLYLTMEFVDNLFTKEELDKFDDWIFAQACPLIDKEVAYYPWDVTRFIRHELKKS